MKKPGCLLLICIGLTQFCLQTELHSQHLSLEIAGGMGRMNRVLKENTNANFARYWHTYFDSTQTGKWGAEANLGLRIGLGKRWAIGVGVGYKNQGYQIKREEIETPCRSINVFYSNQTLDCVGNPKVSLGYQAHIRQAAFPVSVSYRILDRRVSLDLRAGAALMIVLTNGLEGRYLTEKGSDYRYDITYDAHFRLLPKPTEITYLNYNLFGGLQGSYRLSERGELISQLTYSRATKPETIRYEQSFFLYDTSLQVGLRIHL